MDRIVRSSRAVKLIAVALFWVSIICWPMYGYMAVVAESTPLRIIAGWGLFAAAVMAAMFHHAARLAALYGEGVLFTNKNVAHLRWIGRLTLLTVVTPGLAPGEGSELVVDFDFHVSVLLVGLIVVFLSWVMDEARKLKSDSDLVI